MAPNILLFEKYGAQNDMKCFFWRPLLFGFFFSGKFGRIQAKPFAPPKIYLLLHLCLGGTVDAKNWYVKENNGQTQ